MFSISPSSNPTMLHSELITGEEYELDQILDSRLHNMERCHGHTDLLCAEHEDEAMNTRYQELTID